MKGTLKLQTQTFHYSVWPLESSFVGNQYFTYVKVSLFLHLCATVNYTYDRIATFEHQSTRILIGNLELTVARARACVALKRKLVMHLRRFLMMTENSC